MEDLQGLLEKINREGVEKADAEAKKIVGEATAKAAGIVKAAREEAAKAKADAEGAAAAYAERAKETLRQAARDVVLEVENSVTSVFNRMLAENVDKALADESAAVGLVKEAIRSLTGPGEIVCGAKLAAALKSQIAAEGGFTVVTDDSTGSGFKVRVSGGRVEHEFTGAAITAEMARRLRPDLAELLK
ncbi:MAG: hypothetical protein J6T01_03130 [Kiritimatiellae bacterium]|nr:hypothetical protein [Kiritimatiellia bacterium]